jgi:hypothetical protein
MIVTVIWGIFTTASNNLIKKMWPKWDLILWPTAHKLRALTHELHSISLLDYKLPLLKHTIYSQYNSQCPSLYECAVRAKWKKLKLTSDGGDSGGKKCKWGYGRVWWCVRLAGVWSQAVGFVLVRLAGIWLQSPWRCFHIFFYKEILCILYFQCDFQR